MVDEWFALFALSDPHVLHEALNCQHEQVSDAGCSKDGRLGVAAEKAAGENRRPD